MTAHRALTLVSMILIVACTTRTPMTAEVDQLMADYMGDGPGAALLVVKDGRPLTRSYGYADLESRTPVMPSTNFRLASMTKQFTAAAILLLVEDGKLTLDDGLRTWLPSLPAVAQPITLRHVLTHTSGLIDYEDVIPATMTHQLHDADVLTILERQQQLYFTPGTSYRYSNSGYALLALIVTNASGQPFAQFLKARIFTPLGMHGTVAHEDGVSTVEERAFGHSEVDGQWQRTDQSQTSAVLGDGGIYSSLEDLANWDAALYDERLLKPASRELLFTPATKTDDPRIEYAMGWRVTDDTVWHSGETIGFRNVIVRWPNERMTVIVLTNRNDPEPYALALKIARAAKGP